MLNPSARVVIIGAGNVGASIAYSILNQEIAEEILIMDIAEEMARAQVLDMQDASNFTHGVKVSYADYGDIKDGDIIIITCGAAQKEGQTRTELLGINVKIIKDVVSKIKATGKDVFICMVTNPVDVLTFIAIKESGLPVNQVFGSGTNLDTARLRVAISKSTGINPVNVHAYIIGEHGDSSLPVLSNANIANISLDKYVEINETYYHDIAQQVRNTAYEIIKGKKATYYGIGSAVALICQTIIRNEHKIMALSVILNGEYGHSDVCIGIPALIDSRGARVAKELTLDNKEKDLFAKSVDIIKKNIADAVA